MAEQLMAGKAQERVDFKELPIAILAGFGCAFILVSLIAVPLGSKMAATRDFVSFWATGHQLVERGNPYDREAIATIEHSAGLPARNVLIMRNPPWALVLVLPLGLLGLRLAFIAWSLLLLSCLLFSMHWLRGLHGSPPNHVHWLGLAFTPAVICFSIGQTSLFALFGFVLFLRLHPSRPFWAGAALWFCMLKPHLFLPFSVALAAWIVFTRGYRVLAGAATALALSSAGEYLIDPRAWPDYLETMRSPAVANDVIPCLSYMLRRWLWPQEHWVEYLPAAIACVWALIYYWRRRRTWDWVAGSSPLMLISLLAAPYAWLYDQCLAIPALVDAGYGNGNRRHLAFLGSAIFALDLSMCWIPILSPWNLWTMPVWLAFYLWTSASTRPRRSDSKMVSC